MLEYAGRILTTNNNPVLIIQKIWKYHTQLFFLLGNVPHSLVVYLLYVIESGILYTEWQIVQIQNIMSANK